MRLCFLYKDTYAPYSKWLGTAFDRLDVDEGIKIAIRDALSAVKLEERERKIVEAQARVAELHNASGLTDYVDYKIENYFGRDIKVIFAEKFAEETGKKLAHTVFENVPLIGTFSQVGGLSSFSDDAVFYERIASLYRSCAAKWGS